MLSFTKHIYILKHVVTFNHAIYSNIKISCFKIEHFSITHVIMFIENISDLSYHYSFLNSFG